jgi:hypothetical protein
MDAPDFDSLKLNYENALGRWIMTIRHLQELLATPTHSARSKDVWEQADFEHEDAQKLVKNAKRA